MIFTNGRENQNNRLTCLDEFQADAALPRWAALHPPIPQNPDDLDELRAHDGMSVSWRSTVNPRRRGFFVTPQRLLASSLRRLWRWWQRRQAMSARGQTRLRMFFELLLSDPNLVLEFKGREEVTERALEKAQQAGQRELVTQLTQRREIQRAENAMLTFGIKKAVTEEQLLQYARMTGAGLHLDWLARFTRPIPDEVLSRKAACDKLCLFDNYVVLYIDFNNEMQRKVEADIERRRVAEMARDPILFGVLEGSRKLYFVADWIDEFCDLTLDQIMRKLEHTLEMEAPKP